MENHVHGSFFKIQTLCLEWLQVDGQMERQVERFPVRPSLSPHAHSLPIISIPAKQGIGCNRPIYTDMSLFTEEPGVHQGHSECGACYGPGQMYGDMDPPLYSITQNIPTVLKPPCAPPAHPSLTPNHGPSNCLRHFPSPRRS